MGSRGPGKALETIRLLNVRVDDYVRVFGAIRELLDSAFRDKTKLSKIRQLVDHLK